MEVRRRRLWLRVGIASALIVCTSLSYFNECQTSSKSKETLLLKSHSSPTAACLEENWSGLN